MERYIICDDTIKNINNLCYPEDREPIRSNRNIEDFSFLDKISMEETRKYFTFNRKFSCMDMSHEDISEINGEDYLDVFKKIENKLLSIGGIGVSFNHRSFISIEDLKKILNRGQFLDGSTAKRTQGEAGRCHENSAEGWNANKDKSIIMTGFALSSNGFWFFHSWLINVKAHSQLLETTPTKRLAYFGYALNLKESEELYFNF